MKLWICTCSCPQNPTATAKNIEVVLVKASTLFAVDQNSWYKGNFIKREFTCVGPTVTSFTTLLRGEVIMPMFQSSASSAVHQ